VRLIIFLSEEKAKIIIVALEDFMTIRQREHLIKHRGDTETLREVSMSFNDFMRQNLTCQYQHVGKGLIAMLRAMALTTERTLAK
jgi:hypothetical protein